MVAAMKQGSVIVDMAAEAGGNCEATRPGELHVHNGVTVIGGLCPIFHNLAPTDSLNHTPGYADLPSRLPTQSSTLYSNNITKFLLSLGGDGKFAIDLEDEVVRGSIVVHEGSVLPSVPRVMPSPVTPPPTPAKVEDTITAITPWQKASREVALVTAGMGGTVALGKATGAAFMDSFFTFGLAGLVGYRFVIRSIIDGTALSLHLIESYGVSPQHSTRPLCRSLTRFLDWCVPWHLI